ncbi:MAG TPA: FAD-dependent oxidoreductase [Candidatus Aquicultor sp.]|jgi:NADPH-dependent 2,4-dienoyl-CoA reductase/sulfur reductase-like enzyme/rhodanese-related sulfurtransferase
MSLKVVIIGGVAGGASAAARLRRLDETAEIVLFEKDKYISFANCGLPYYIGDVIEERGDLLVQTPERMRERFNIDVRVRSEVIRILPDEKKVEVRNFKNGESYLESYDKLILSPGAVPHVPPVKGVDHPRVFTIRNVPDTDAVKGFVETNKPERAVVIGAGFIGMEMAENLYKKGVKVTIIELSENIIPMLDFEMAALAERYVIDKGIEVIRGTTATTLDRNGELLVVELINGRRIETDMVVFGIGVRPEATLAKESGLAIGQSGGIAVDEYLLTSDANIYAIGDAIEVTNLVSGTPALIPLAGPANKQGRIAADNVCGRQRKYKTTQGTAILKIFDMAVASTGLNERGLMRAGIAYQTAICHPFSHATYFPGASMLSVKVLFDAQDGTLLGAQVVGEDSVDKIIDAFSMAVRAGMTVFDLTELEFAYAPPFSSAKSPVNMAGYVASNILSGDVAVATWRDVDNIDPDHVAILDVRTSYEHKHDGNIKGALHIPVDDLRARMHELPKDKEIYVYCRVGMRAYIACRILKQNGYNVRNISGGFITYKAAHDVLAVGQKVAVS